MIPLVMTLLAFFQAADCRSCDLLADMASALSEGNSVRFLNFLDKSTPGYYDLSSNVQALTAQNDVSASLDVLSESGDDENREALVDWYLQAVSKNATQHVTRRRMRVKISQVKRKGGWKITRMEPRSILDPIDVTTAE